MGYHPARYIASFGSLANRLIALWRRTSQATNQLLMAATFVSLSLLIVLLIGSQTAGAFGALAVGEGGQGASWDYQEVGSARGGALKACGADCRVVITFKSTCAAFAVDQSKDGAIGWAYASTKEYAQNMALDFCRHSGGKACGVRVSACEGTIVNDARAFAVYEGDAMAGINAVAELSSENPNAGFIFPDSDRRRLSAADLADLSAGELRIARNEIFARRGRMFVGLDLSFYFSQFTWYAPTAPEVTLSDIEKTNVGLIVNAEHSTTQMPTPSPGDLIFPDSDSRILTQAELDGLSAAELRIARNEIFARRGRHFESIDLKEHFATFAWYHPNTWNPKLNAIEEQNVRLIKEAESRR